MTTIKHSFTVGIADDPTAAAKGEVLPSHWNAAHVDSGGNSLTIRTQLTADTNYYVAAIGSDSNAGTLASPWLTIQHAMDFISKNIDIAGFFVTINIGAGTFAGVGLKGTVGGGVIYFNGAGSASTTINNGPNDGTFNFGECFSVWATVNSSYCFNNMKLAPAKAGLVPFNNAFNVFAAGFFNIFDVRHFATPCDFVIDCTGMGAADVVWWIGAAGIQFQLNGIIYTGGGATIANVFIVEDGAVVFDGQNGTASTVNGNLTTSSFCFCDAGGVYQTASAAFSAGGTVTGIRFQMLSNGYAFSGLGVGAMGLNFFPGDQPGTLDPTSAYDGYYFAQPITHIPTIATELKDAGGFGLFKDSVGGGIYLAYNDAGTLQVNASYFASQSGFKDIGSVPFSNRVGYGRDYVTDKQLVNCTIGFGSEAGTDGQLRHGLAILDGITTETFQIFQNNEWETIAANIALRDNEPAENHALEHYPVANWIQVFSGDSEMVSMNGLPLIQGYQADMGAFPVPQQLNGGNILMVSLVGAENAQPYVTEINKLQAAFNALAAAITGNGTIWKIVIDAYVGGPSITITILDDFSGPDSAAILNDIKNVIGTKINIQTNTLGQIS